MRRGIGAIFTTGLALVGAVVVVANPVLAPPSDVRIPAVSLSADASASAGVLDPALLKAIAQYPAEPAPAELFRRLLAELVAGAAVLGGHAVEGGFWVPSATGAPAAALPTPPTADLLDVGSFTLAAAEVRAAAPATVAQSPVVQHTVAAIATNVDFLGRQVTAAALAAGAIVSAEPRLIAETLAALSKGDIQSAIRAVLRAVATPLVPPLIIVNAIGTVVGERLTELGRLIPPPLRAALKAPGPAVAPAEAATLGSIPVRTLPRSLASTARSAAAGQPRRNVAGLASSNGATDLSDGNKVVPHLKRMWVPPPRTIAGAVDQVRASGERLGAVLRKAIRSHRP